MADNTASRTRSQYSRKGVVMKTVLLLTLVLMLGASMAFAQAGTIGIYSDPTGTSCNLTATPGLVFYYFLHVNTTGARVSAWAAPAPTCFPATYLGYFAEDPYWLCIGDPESGISISYGGVCHVGTFVILKAIYNVLEPATDCCLWSVGPHPAFGTIDAADCDFNTVHPSGDYGIINSTPACPCGAVPTEDTTWGQVKALYE